MLVAALAAGGLILVASDDSRDDAPARAGFEGAVLPPDVRAPDFELSDQEGDPVTMREYRGGPVVVTFLYTNCEDSCPPQAQQIRGAFDQLGEDVPALAVAVDPPRDTAESARRFLGEQRLTGRMRFVLGTRAELRPVWRGFAIRPQSAAQEHSPRIFLVDARGVQRVSFPLDQATPERIAHDLRLLGAG